MQRESRRLTRFTIKHTARRHSGTTVNGTAERGAQRLISWPIQYTPELLTLPPVRTRSVGRRTTLSLLCFAQTFIVIMDGSGHHFSPVKWCAQAGVPRENGAIRGRVGAHAQQA